MGKKDQSEASSKSSSRHRRGRHRDRRSKKEEAPQADTLIFVERRHRRTKPSERESQWQKLQLADNNASADEQSRQDFSPRAACWNNTKPVYMPKSKYYEEAESSRRDRSSRRQKNRECSFLSSKEKDEEEINDEVSMKSEASTKSSRQSRRRHRGTSKKAGKKEYTLVDRRRRAQKSSSSAKSPPFASPSASRNSSRTSRGYATPPAETASTSEYSHGYVKVSKNLNPCTPPRSPKDNTVGGYVAIAVDPGSLRTPLTSPKASEDEERYIEVFKKRGNEISKDALDKLLNSAAAADNDDDREDGEKKRSKKPKHHHKKKKEAPTYILFEKKDSPRRRRESDGRVTLADLQRANESESQWGRVKLADPTTDDQISVTSPPPRSSRREKEEDLQEGSRRGARQKKHRGGRGKKGGKVPALISDHEEAAKCYLGAKTKSAVAKYLKPNDFKIYYRIPENSVKIPYKLRLYLAYMSSNNKKVYNFPITCRAKDQEEDEVVWSLGHAFAPATFPSLGALIKYHQTYAYMDPSTGKVDTFPIWNGFPNADENNNKKYDSFDEDE